MSKFEELRNKYPEVIYNNYQIEEKDNQLIITYEFITPSLDSFHPTIKFNKAIIKNKNIDNNLLNYIVFHIGLIELISYYKPTCSPQITIKCGYLNKNQIKWYKKLLYHGLEELFYVNKINVKMDELVTINCECINKPVFSGDYNGSGNLIPIGGGKDSCVSLEILKNENGNSCFIINPKKPSLDCAYVAGYKEEDILCVERNLDKKMVELKDKGFINGHTPFSAIVAFISYLCAYLSNKKYVLISNESSSNEPTVKNSTINHQYSKSFEFEKDFDKYVHKYFKIDLNYVSLLRGLSEYHIGYLFSKYEKYHKVFRSCNLGSKSSDWKWCCNCPKCLFVYIVLSPHLYKEKLINIFGEDLFERKDLLKTFIEIIGESEVKPFDCVGTTAEAKYAISKLITQLDKNDLPYLLKYYYENYDLSLNSKKIMKYNKKNNLNKHFNDLVLEEINNK